MKKLIASVLTLVCILTLARCGKSGSGDYPATIMVNGTNYYSTDHAVPVEVDESVIQYTTSYAENGIPQKDGEANFNRDLGTPYAVIEDDSVVVLIDNEWIEFKAKWDNFKSDEEREAWKKIQKEARYYPEFL